MLIPIDDITYTTPKKLQLNKMQSASVQQRRAFKQNKPTLTFRCTTKFCKHKNIIQSNKQNLQTTRHLSTFRQTISQHPLTHHSLFKKQLPTSRSSNKFQSNQYIQSKSSLPNIQSFFLQHNQNRNFSPKNKSKILLKYKSTLTGANNSPTSTKSPAINNKINQQSDGLSKLLRKNHLYAQRCLLGMNIPKIQETYQFSRFQLFNLYTHYNTLIQSVKSLQEMRKGFQSILYINRIELNSQMIDQMFSDFSKNISFDSFIKVYGNIQNLLFTQNIIQSIKEMFKSYYRDELIRPDRVLDAFREWMDDGDAVQVKKMIYSQLNHKSENKDISIKQMIKACQQNLHLCRKVFHSINKAPTNTNSNKQNIK